jgi:hypothetical protein
MIVSFVIVTHFEIKHVRNFETIHWIISSGGGEKNGKIQQERPWATSQTEAKMSST